MSEVYALERRLRNESICTTEEWLEAVLCRLLILPNRYCKERKEYGTYFTKMLISNKAVLIRAVKFISQNEESTFLRQIGA